jgi:hypothetical protein
MHDDLADLERTLRDRAAEVPSLQDVPRNMMRRARRRIVRNAVVSVVAAGFVVVGVSAGLASLRATTDDVPRRSPDPAPPSSSCVAADLRATAALQGAAGSVGGSIELTNVGTRTCTLEGRPAVTLFSAAGHELTVQVVDVDPQWRADAAPTPPGWPVVRLRPDASAAIRVSWTNPCPQLIAPARWEVDLGSGRGALDVAGADVTPPACNGSGEPSTLDVGPVEPANGA